MFKLVGIEEIIRNIIKLTKNYQNSCYDKMSLLEGYRNFLKAVQPKVPKPIELSIAFLSSRKDIMPLIEAFEEDSILDDFTEVFSEGKESNYLNSLFEIERILSLMRKINAHYADIIELSIHTIFSASSKYAGGGSTSAAIGCIWIDSRPHWKDQDFLEFLIHETTHNLIFLDELCFTHYLDYSEIAKEKNFAWSAILNKERPLDKVFHSIIVSTEVILFRDEYIGHPEKPSLHPPSEILFSQTERSINHLKNNFHLCELLTPRAQELLNKCWMIIEEKKELKGLVCEV